MPLSSIRITEGANNNVIENNIIAGTRNGGIGQSNRLLAEAPLGNIIRNNRVGVGPNGENIAPVVPPDNILDPEFDRGAYAVGIHATAGDTVEGNIVGNFGLSGIEVRNFSGDPNQPPAVVRDNQISNTKIGIQVGAIRGATIEGNTLTNCSTAGIAVSDNLLDATNLYAVPPPRPNPTGLETINIRMSRNRFVDVAGPGIGFTESVLKLTRDEYRPNLLTELQFSGPNLYQPSLRITAAERQSDGSVVVTGRSPGAGTIEWYTSTRAARPGAPETDVDAYGLGTFLTDAQVGAGDFRLTIPADKIAGVTALTATVTVNNQTSEFARTVEVKNTEPPVDTEKPTVTVSAPAAGLTVESREGASVNVAWTARDNVGVASQSIQLTGKRNGQAFSESAATGLPGAASSFTLTIRRDDAVVEAQITVEARDAAGNVGQGKSGLFTITAPVPADTQKPVVSNIVLNKKKVVRKTDSTLIISWQSIDNVRVTAHDLRFAADGSAFSTAIATGLPGDMKSFTWSVPDKSILPKTKTGIVKVTARDAAGNAGEATSGSFTVK